MKNLVIYGFIAFFIIGCGDTSENQVPAATSLEQNQLNENQIDTISEKDVLLAAEAVSDELVEVEKEADIQDNEQAPDAIADIRPVCKDKYPRLVRKLEQTHKRLNHFFRVYKTLPKWAQQRLAEDTAVYLKRLVNRLEQFKDRLKQSAICIKKDRDVLALSSDRVTPMACYCTQNTDQIKKLIHFIDEIIASILKFMLYLSQLN